MQRANPGKGPHLSLEPLSDVAPYDGRIRMPAAFVSHLSIDDVEELRVAIERSLCEGEMLDSTGTTVNDELRKSLRIACAKARLQRVRAEHVVVDLKQLWMALPGVLTAGTAGRLSAIVSACIAEYYADDSIDG